MCSGTTIEKYVEVLYFSHFFKHYEFVEDELGYRKKVLKTHIPVSVVVPLVCGNITEEKDKDALKREIFSLSHSF